MTPRQYLKRYIFDERIVTGTYYPTSPLHIERDECIGVVLMNFGGPEDPEDVAPFLYNLYMDPAILDMPIGGRLRHWLCKLISARRSANTGKEYEVIGGGSPMNRLTKEQAGALESYLTKKIGVKLGVEFKTYVVMRYWHPMSRKVAEKMHQDGVDKVVLLPLFPQYSKTTSGSSFAYWWYLEKEGEIPGWPTTTIVEYAAHPKYIRAISERIDEALQRFPRTVRGDVQLLFSPHGTPVKEKLERRDPYCCLVHSTIDRVMKLRDFDRPYHVAFRNRTGSGEWFTPSTSDKLRELGLAGHKAVLIIPVSYVTDHVETAFVLDVKVRAKARQWGVEYFEVSSGLNCHSLFIEALAETVVSQLITQGQEGTTTVAGDGHQTREQYSPHRLDLVRRYQSSERTTRCHQCQQTIEARCWETPATTPANTQ